jgi:Barstar (barnase inhibitor)
VDGGRLQFDYSLLQNGAVTLFWRSSVMDRAIEILKQLDYRLIDIDATGLRSVQALRDAFANEIPELPRRYFGNYDAFMEALFDMDFAPGGVAIALRNYDAFFHRVPGDARTLLDIIESASRLCLLYGRRTVCLVQVQDQTIDFGLLGGRHPRWNDAELMHSARGRDSDPAMVWWMVDD